jgi:hypothetical protein
LFGPTNPEIWAPIGKDKFYIKKGNSIDEIKTDDVIQLIDFIFSQQIENKGK